MGWLLAGNRKERQQHRERIAALNKEYENVFCLAKVTFEYREPTVAAPGVEYVFCAGAPDEDSDFQHIALEVMEEILKPYQVLTHVYTYGYDAKGTCYYKPKKPCRHYVPYWRRYYRFLQYHDLTENVLLHENGHGLITITQGLDLALMRADIEVGLLFNPNDSYGYTRLPFQFVAFEETLKKAEDGNWDVYLKLEESHDNLWISINSETVDIGSIADILRRVCEKHGKKLEDNSQPV